MLAEVLTGDIRQPTVTFHAGRYNNRGLREVALMICDCMMQAYVDDIPRSRPACNRWHTTEPALTAQGGFFAIHDLGRRAIIPALTREAAAADQADDDDDDDFHRAVGRKMRKVHEACSLRPQLPFDRRRPHTQTAMVPPTKSIGRCEGTSEAR